MAATVTIKGQVTIPKQVRELLGIGPGSVIDLERTEDGRIAERYRAVTTPVEIEPVSASKFPETGNSTGNLSAG